MHSVKQLLIGRAVARRKLAEQCAREADMVEAQAAELRTDVAEYLAEAEEMDRICAAMYGHDDSEVAA